MEEIRRLNKKVLDDMLHNLIEIIGQQANEIKQMQKEIKKIKEGK